MATFPLLAWHPGIWELVILLLIVLVLFGSRLPKVARSLGQGITEFKKGVGEGGRHDDDAPKPPPPAPPTPVPPPPPV
jgi:sec-independent protein translocase protein TatA